MTEQKFSIDAHNLSKQYPLRDGWIGQISSYKESVTNVSLQIKKGEIFGLTGANGAGKTTLAKMLCTLIAPSSGLATIAGIRLALENGDEIRKRIGLVVTDERSFYWRLTGRQNLTFFAALHNRFGEKTKMHIEQLLASVNLLEHADVRFDRYSSGMKQRLAIARGILHQPEVLFLDEPSRSLDRKSKENIQLLIRKLNMQQKMTVFIISHDQEELIQLCSRVGTMQNGRLADITMTN
ncbi:MAG: ABC transporter ATP-binding protein [Chloroflexota bacterium]